MASGISSKQDIRYGSGGALWLAFNPAVPASENSWNNYVTFSLAGLVFARLAQVHSFTVQVSRKSTARSTDVILALLALLLTLCFILVALWPLWFPGFYLRG